MLAAYPLVSRMEVSPLGVIFGIPIVNMSAPGLLTVCKVVKVDSQCPLEAKQQSYESRCVELAQTTLVLYGMRRRNAVTYISSVASMFPTSIPTRLSHAHAVGVDTK
eukprot:4402825-Pyramimonas_sp.AAC.1